MKLDFLWTCNDARGRVFLSLPRIFTQFVHLTVRSSSFKERRQFCLHKWNTNWVEDRTLFVCVCVCVCVGLRLCVSILKNKFPPTELTVRVIEVAPVCLMSWFITAGVTGACACVEHSHLYTMCIQLCVSVCQYTVSSHCLVHINADNTCYISLTLQPWWQCSARDAEPVYGLKLATSLLCWTERIYTGNNCEIESRHV